jgi:hypothetical protein
MVVSVGDGGSILGLLGFVHIEMISSIILSASKTRGDYNNDGGNSSSSLHHHHTNSSSSSSGASSSHKKRRRAKKRGTTSVGASAWSYHELPVFLQQRQNQKQQDIEEQRHEQDKIEEDRYYLHSAVTAIGMLIGIIVTFSVEWILDHFRLVATHEDDHSYYYYPSSSPTTTSSSHGGRHHYYMKKDWSVLYGGLMTGILCGCIWNICNLNYDMDRRTADRVRLFYGLTLVTIPMLMVGVYSINSTM